MRTQNYQKKIFFYPLLRTRVSGSQKCSFFGRFCVRTKWMILNILTDLLFACLLLCFRPTSHAQMAPIRHVQPAVVQPNAAKHIVIAIDMNPEKWYSNC